MVVVMKQAQGMVEPPCHPPLFLIGWVFGCLCLDHSLILVGCSVKEARVSRHQRRLWRFSFHCQFHFWDWIQPPSCSSVTLGWMCQVRTDHLSSAHPPLVGLPWCYLSCLQLNQRGLLVSFLPAPPTIPGVPHDLFPQFEAGVDPSFPPRPCALSCSILSFLALPLPFIHFLLPAKKSHWRSLSARVPFNLFYINAPLWWPTAESFTCNVI